MPRLVLLVLVALAGAPATAHAGGPAPTKAGKASAAAEAPPRYRVVPKWVNVLGRPRKKATPIGKLDRWEVIRPLEIKGRWAVVRVKGTTMLGYVPLSALEPVTAEIVEAHEAEVAAAEEADVLGRIDDYLSWRSWRFWVATLALSLLFFLISTPLSRMSRGMYAKRHEDASEEDLEWASWFPWYTGFIGFLLALPTAFLRPRLLELAAAFPLDPRGLDALGWAVWVVVVVLLPLGVLGLVVQSFQDLGPGFGLVNTLGSLVLGAIGLVFSVLFCTALIYLVIGVTIFVIVLTAIMRALKGLSQIEGGGAESVEAGRRARDEKRRKEYAREWRRIYHGDEFGD